jgi:hypothetical protein
MARSETIKGYLDRNNKHWLDLQTAEEYLHSNYKHYLDSNSGQMPAQKLWTVAASSTVTG